MSSFKLLFIDSTFLGLHPVVLRDYTPLCLGVLFKQYSGDHIGCQGLTTCKANTLIPVRSLELILVPFKKQKVKYKI